MAAQPEPDRGSLNPFLRRELKVAPIVALNRIRISRTGLQPKCTAAQDSSYLGARAGSIRRFKREDFENLLSEFFWMLKRSWPLTACPQGSPQGRTVNRKNYTVNL